MRASLLVKSIEFIIGHTRARACAHTQTYLSKMLVPLIEPSGSITWFGLIMQLTSLCTPVKLSGEVLPRRAMRARVSEVASMTSALIRACVCVVCVVRARVS